MSAAADDRRVVEIDHPAPTLVTLDLEHGGGILYDDEELDAWIQADDDHYLLMDGRWR